jgi:catechol 2,3-dioxygenase-like lactoylglutathione lyase family enzyme
VAPLLPLRVVPGRPRACSHLDRSNAGFDAYERVGILLAKRGAGYEQLVADMIAPTPRPGHLAELALDDNGILLACDSRADRIFQFDTRKRELVKSWSSRGDGSADLALDRARHRLFVGSRVPPEVTIYDSMSGREIQSLPAPETMDGVHYDAKLKPRAGPHTSGELMFDHVLFGVSDYAASKAFFLKALEPLGVAVVLEGPLGVELSPDGKSSLCICQTEEKPAHLHLAFTAENRQQVEAFYRAALEAGGKDNGAPGLRPHYHANYYAAFVIGPDGHNIEVVCHEPEA